MIILMRWFAHALWWFFISSSACGSWAMSPFLSRHPKLYLSGIGIVQRLRMTPKPVYGLWQDWLMCSECRHHSTLKEGPMWSLTQKETLLWPPITFVISTQLQKIELQSVWDNFNQIQHPKLSMEPLWSEEFLKCKCQNYVFQISSQMRLSLFVSNGQNWLWNNH